MPNIIIREYDNTKAGISQYNNFTVLIAGSVSASAHSECFDQNGVYEVSSQKDFEDNVGCIGPTQYYLHGQKACDPELDDKTFEASEAVAAVAGEALDANEEPAEGVQYYTREASSAGAGHLNDGTYAYEPVESVNIPSEHAANIYFPLTNVGEDAKTAEENFNAFLGEFSPDEHLYLRQENKTGKSGFLKTAEYDFSGNGELGISEWDSSYETIPNEPVYFGVIKEAKRGRDGAVAISYGNLMAYTLLGLGYTILYKKVEFDENENARLEEDNFWAPLKDKSEYDFRYVTHGLVSDTDPNVGGGSTAGVNAAIIKLAHFKNNFDKSENDDTGRGDCIALCELNALTYAGKNQADAVLSIMDDLKKETVSKYAAYFGPYVVYSVDKDRAPWNKFYDNETSDVEVGKFPAVFHYLACAAKASENFNEWYAIAGYTCGISDFTIDHTGCTFGEVAYKALQPRFKKDGGIPFAVNLIAKIRGGYYLWGNRTAFELGVENTNEGDLRASHFLNIRQLCTTIKKQVYITCRKYTFDPNSDLLWAKFCNDIRPTLEKMKADQGITDYKFIKVKTNKKALLKAKIRIVPIEAVEDFDISLTLEDSISGIVAGVDEADAE